MFFCRFNVQHFCSSTSVTTLFTASDSQTHDMSLPKTSEVLRNTENHLESWHNTEQVNMLQQEQANLSKLVRCCTHQQGVIISQVWIITRSTSGQDIHLFLCILQKQWKLFCSPAEQGLARAACFKMQKSHPADASFGVRPFLKPALNTYDHILPSFVYVAFCWSTATFLGEMEKDGGTSDPNFAL